MRVGSSPLEAQPHFTLPQEGKQGEDGAGWTQLPMEAPGQPAGGSLGPCSHWDSAFISPDLSQLLP